MRKFMMLLLLLPVQVFAQAVDYTRTQSSPGSNIPLEYINQNRGTALSLGDDQVNGPINIGFDFTFYGRQFTTTRISNNGVIGFQNPINGCCTGYNLETEGNEYGIFALQTDLLNIETTNPWYRTEGQEGSRTFTVGWYDMPIYNNTNYRSTFEITLFEGSNNILLNYGNIDVYNRRYTAGIKGNNQDILEVIHSGFDNGLMDYTSFVFSYQSIPEPLVWTTVANENESFVLYAESSVRYGSNGVYVTETLGPGVHSCSNDVFGDPTPGIVKQCQVLLPEEESAPVNCQITPNIPECIVESLEDYDMSDAIDQNIVNTEETVVLADNIEETIEDVLVEDNDINELVEETPVAREQETTIREIANEERASSLADNINVNVLEQVLSNAENIAQPTTNIEPTTSAVQTARTTNTATETVETKTEETKVDLEISLVENSTETANELLDTGRNLNNQSLAAIQTQTEQSSIDSNNVAESIAITSSDTATDKVQETIQINIDTENTDNMAAETAISTNDTTEIVETIIVQNAAETTVDVAVSEEQTNETSVVEESSSTIDNLAANTEQTPVADENIDQTNQQIYNETELELLETIVATQSLVATQTEQKKEDDNMTFNEEERLTLQSDINLQNAFNVVPNMNNLEQAGVLQKQEDKSDAEKKADQIVAANAKEQEEINNNYMDADQSGILGAMTVDTDVTSYRNSMLNDNSLWYKPEDIYKNKVYKDNVRGMYFLEKGNTDTYKQMVDEQYGEK